MALIDNGMNYVIFYCRSYLTLMIIYQNLQENLSFLQFLQIRQLLQRWQETWGIV